MEKETCLLCFQDIETTPGECDLETSYYVNNSYKQIIFESCKRLLGVKVNAFNWSYSPENCSVHCLRCIYSSEKLWKIEEKLNVVKNELENFIATFSNEILQSRLHSLSKKLEIPENDPPADNNSDEPLIVSTTNTITELDVESVKLEQFDDDNFLSGISDDENEYDLPSPVETTVSENLHLNEKVLNEPNNAETSNKLLELSINRRQLKVTLQRLEIDSKGKVIQQRQDCMKGRLRKRKAAIAARNSLLTKRLLDENLGDAIDDDEEFVVEDLNIRLEEEGSDSDNETSKRKRKRKTRIGQHLPLKCNECSIVFSIASELNRHSVETGHKLERIFRCEKCDKQFYSYSIYRAHLKSHKNKSQRKLVKSRSYKIQSQRKLVKMKTQNINGKTLKRKLQNFKCVVCSDTFEFARQLDNHSTESGHENKREHKCEQCDKTYYRRIDVTVHRPKCNYRSKTCEYCDKFCRKYSSYCKHVKTHKEWRLDHPRENFRKKDALYRKFKCAECEAIFNFGRDLKAHSEESGHVNIPAFKCEDCSKKYYKKYHLKIHIEEVHKINPQSCSICNQEFTTSSTFRSHMSFHNPKNKRYQENYNLRKMRKSSNAKNETDKKMMQTQKKSKPPKDTKFECPVCKIIFTQIRKFRRHVANEHRGEKRYKCTEDNCNAMFTNSANLYQHKKNHSFKTKVQCPICHLFYKSEGWLNIHLQKAHSEKKRFPCDSCDESFNEIKEFVAHKITAHGMKSPFVCKHCESSFTYQADRTLHFRSVHNEHINNKEHMKCHVCQEQFKTLAEHLYHILSHTDIPKELLDKATEEEIGTFLCEDCGKIFTCKKYLISHTKRNHQERKNKECPICHKILLNKRTFSKHIRIHNDSTKVICPICGRGFSENDNMKAHYKRIHEQNKIPRKPYTKTQFAQPKQFVDVSTKSLGDPITFSNLPGRPRKQ